jgi:hypothetical protein
VLVEVGLLEIAAPEVLLERLLGEGLDLGAVVGVSMWGR